MKIIFDRTAYLNETSVLTNFEKKHEIPADSPVEALAKRFVSQHLRLKGLAGEAANWRLIAIADMEWRELAWVKAGELVYVNCGPQTLQEFLGSRQPVTILAVFLRPEEAQTLGPVAAAQIPERPWIKLALPIRIQTRWREILAFFCALLALVSVALLLSQSDAIPAPVGLAAIAFALAFYLLLLRSRHILFSSKTVLYRNSRGQYEKFSTQQIEYLDWSNHGHSLRFVFKFEEKKRNYISAQTEDYLQVIVWSISNGIPLYSTDSVKQGR